MSIFGDLARAAGEFLGGAASAAEETVETIVETAEDVVDAVNGAAEDAGRAAGEAADAAVNAGRQAIDAAINFGSGVLHGGDILGDAAGDLFGRIVSNPGQLANEFLDGAGAATEFLAGNIGREITELGSTAERGLDLLGDVAERGIDDVQRGIGDLVEQGSRLVDAGVDLAGDVARDTVKAAVETVRVVDRGLDVIGDKAREFGQDVIEKGEQVRDTVIDAIVDAGKEFKEGFEQGSDSDLDAGVSTSQQALLDKGEPVKVADQVSSSLKSAIEEFQDRLADGSLTKFELPEELPPSIVDKIGGLGPVIPGKGGVNGTDGNDILNGSSMSELLTGGKGIDTFRFDSLADSRIGAIDRIMDFGRGDKIDLSGIDAMMAKSGDQSFSLVEHGSKMGAGQLSSHFDAKSGMTIVEAHTNNDGVADFSLQLAGNVELTKNDFVL